MSYLAAHLEEALTVGRRLTHPFPIIMFQPFPDSLYPEVLFNLPDDHFYHNMVHVDTPPGTRTYFDLRNETINNLPKLQRLFWRSLTVDLVSWDVCHTFQQHLTNETKAAKPVVRLLRDFNGYKIFPHPDSSKKIVTVQFYLPDDRSQHNLGTSFYDDDRGTIAYTVEYLPNAGYCFAVSDHSWHGTEFRAFTKPRNSLILTYYKT